MKRKIAFALLMGVVTTGIISFTLLRVNTGLRGWSFAGVWLRSWALAYIIVIPCILLIAPQVEKLVNKIVKE